MTPETNPRKIPSKSCCLQTAPADKQPLQHKEKERLESQAGTLKIRVTTYTNSGGMDSIEHDQNIGNQ
jgi:hypothetical protein